MSFDIAEVDAVVQMSVPSPKDVQKRAKASGSPKALELSERVLCDRITSRVGQIQRDLGLGNHVGGHLVFGKKGKWSPAAEQALWQWLSAPLRSQPALPTPAARLAIEDQVTPKERPPAASSSSDSSSSESESSGGGVDDMSDGEKQCTQHWAYQQLSSEYDHEVSDNHRLMLERVGLRNEITAFKEEVASLKRKYESSIS